MMNSHFQERLQEFLSTASRPLIVILGATASGKTEVSIELVHEMRKAARAFCPQPDTNSQMGGWSDSEIVNSDSRQLYRLLNIGTAKITVDEMEGIPHHLLDVLDPKEESTAAWYKRVAEKVINEIHERQHVPILVGGSMLYISAFIDGLEFPPVSDASLRERLEKEYDADSGDTLYQKLLELDPDTASAFAKENKPYVVRAMEIYESTGKKPSVARQQSISPYDLLILGIDRSREELMKRIDERTEELFKKGWMEEVQSLLDRGYTEKDPGMKSHGYREIMDSLRNNVTLSPTKGDLQKLISAKTRQYAKRQMTWWRNDPRIEWITL